MRLSRCSPACVAWTRRPSRGQRPWGAGRRRHPDRPGRLELGAAGSLGWGLLGRAWAGKGALELLDGNLVRPLAARAVGIVVASAGSLQRLEGRSHLILADTEAPTALIAAQLHDEPP